MLSVEFSFNPEDRDRYEQLVRKLFAGQRDVQRVRVDALPAGHTGLSNLQICLAYPLGVQDSEYNPLLVRIGPAAQLAAEHAYYEAFVARSTDFRAVQQRRYVTIGDAAAVAYDYLNERDGQPLQTLREFLGRHGDVDVACQAIRALFLETLTKGEQKNGWYNDARSYDQQRPIWFYNTILPAAVTLEFVALDTHVSTALPLAHLLPLADRPEGQQYEEQIVVLRPDDYPYLHIVEREECGETCRLRLHLYEQEPVKKQMYQPPQPIAARIDLIGPSAELRDLEGGRQTLMGRVMDTRFATLEARRRQLGPLPGQLPNGRIAHQELVLENPLQRYYDLLAQPRPLTTSIAHGDMNLSNILLSQLSRTDTAGSSDEADVLTAWLIDFDKTGPGQHAVFDAVKLETEYKVHILPHYHLDVNDFIQLERALHQALIDPDPTLRIYRDRPQLRDAYQFIATIRRVILQKLSRCTIPPAEYYLGLLAYGLAALKYPNLYSNRRDRWLPGYTRLEHLATAAYLSASFAATVIPQCEGLPVQQTSYPRAPRSRQAQRTLRPWLVGRDAILAVAGRQLLPLDQRRPSGDRPFVVLYGQAGSGRWAVADVLRSELEQAGALVCTWEPIRTQPVTVEGFVESVLASLRGLGLRSAARLPQDQATSRIEVRTRETDLHMLRQQLVAALEAPKRSRALALFIQLDTAETELRAFVLQLAKDLLRTPLVVIGDQPFENIHVGIQLEVTPLTLEDVGRYVQYKRLPLDNHAIAHLYAISHGLPRLLERAITAAQRDQHQRSCSFVEAMMMQPDQYTTEYVESFLHLLPEARRHLLELDALLRTYTPEALVDLAVLYREVGPAIGWRVVESEVEDFATVLQQDLDDDLQRRLREVALNQLERRPEFRTLCAKIAQFYQQQGSWLQFPIRFSPHYLIARYQALAGQWDSAAATLHALVDDPAPIFTAHCPHIYDLAEQVYRHSEYVDDKPVLELVGHCAAYLGQTRQAINYYNRLCDYVVAETDPDYPLLVARLAQLYETVNDTAKLQEAAQQLITVETAGTPLHAIGQAYEGSALLASDPDRAVERFHTAKQTLERTRDQWGAERRFYEEQRILLADRLAYAYARLIPGQSAKAITILREVRSTARSLNPALGARIENNLGAIYYDARGQSNGARDAFQRALELRRNIGDRVGQMRSAQNLANVLSSLAKGAEEWDQAEHLFQEAEDIARTVETADYSLVTANHLHLLALRGKFDLARALLSQSDTSRTRHQDTLALLFRNRAQLALLEQDASACQEYLAQTLEYMRPPTLTIHQIEWSQLMFASHLWLSTPIDPRALEFIASVHLSKDERPIDWAEWRFAQGLLAVAQAQYATAQAHFTESRAIWSRVNYHFRVLIVQYWETFCLLQASDHVQARILAGETIEKLKPFGETPLLSRLRELSTRIE